MPDDNLFVVNAQASVRVTDNDSVESRKPDVPQRFEAIAGDGLVTLIWEAPQSDGGNPITHYEYKATTRVPSRSRQA